jgi:hypothetical protein
MKPSKRKRLEKAGWKVGSADDFLDRMPTFEELNRSILERVHERHKPSSKCPVGPTCPWCEIDRLRDDLREARKMAYSVINTIDASSECSDKFLSKT